MTADHSQQEQQIQELRDRFVGQRVGPYIAWNKVGRTQVWQWCSAMGDTNPEYLSGEQVIAPPTMLQSWTFRDVHGQYAPGSTVKNTYEVLGELDDLGFFGSVAVSYDQSYQAYLQEGDHVHSFSTISDISALKTTGLGRGCFVTETAEYYRGEQGAEAELIGSATITYLKYQPAQQQASPPSTPRKIERIRPVENHDSKHYWQGLRDGKLILQQCASCDTVRHPPQPMCEACQSLEWRELPSACEGSVYSFTSIHHPEIPPFDSPNCIVLVDLDEGARIAAQLSGQRYDQIEIGMRVKARILEVQDGLCLPVFEVLP